MAKTEGMLIHIGLKEFLRQVMIGAQNKHLGVADNNVHPMGHAGIGMIGFVLMGAVIQLLDITVVAIAVNHTAIGKGSMSKFLHRAHLILGITHIFKKRRLPRTSKNNAAKDLAFSVPRPRLFPVVGPPKYASSNSITPLS